MKHPPKARFADIYRYRRDNRLFQRDMENRILARKCRCGRCFCCRYTAFLDRCPSATLSVNQRT